MPKQVVRTPDGYKTIEIGSGGPFDFSANTAAVNGGYDDGSVVLRTGTQVNLPAGHTDIPREPITLMMLTRSMLDITITRAANLLLVILIMILWSTTMMFG